MDNREFILSDEQFQVLLKFVDTQQYCDIEHLYAQHVAESLSELAPDHEWAQTAWDYMTYENLCQTASDLRDALHESYTAAHEAQQSEQEHA
mgnify:CR=1 FL=1